MPSCAKESECDFVLEQQLEAGFNGRPSPSSVTTPACDSDEACLLWSGHLDLFSSARSGSLYAILYNFVILIPSLCTAHSFLPFFHSQFPDTEPMYLRFDAHLTDPIPLLAASPFPHLCRGALHLADPRSTLEIGWNIRACFCLYFAGQGDISQ